MAKARIKTQRACPECGKPMDEFAAAWGWEWCYKCSVNHVLAQRKKLIEENL